MSRTTFQIVESISDHPMSQDDAYLASKCPHLRQGIRVSEIEVDDPVVDAPQTVIPGWRQGYENSVINEDQVYASCRTIR